MKLEISALRNVFPYLGEVAKKCDQASPLFSLFSPMRRDGKITLAEINNFKPANEDEKNALAQLATLMRGSEISELDSKRSSVLEVPEYDFEVDRVTPMTKEKLLHDQKTPKLKIWVVAETTEPNPYLRCWKCKIHLKVETEPNTIISFVTREPDLFYDPGTDAYEPNAAVERKRDPNAIMQLFDSGNTGNVTLPVLYDWWVGQEILDTMGLSGRAPEDALTRYDIVVLDRKTLEKKADRSLQTAVLTSPYI